MLDNDPECISYTYEPFSIEYLDTNNISKNYIPDFLVEYKNGIKKLLEIKPAKLMSNIPGNIMKQKAAITYCKSNEYLYEFWNETNMDIEEYKDIIFNEILYRTYSEFLEAVRVLNIKTSIEYRKRYKEDPRLPSSPSNTYSEFTGWRDVLEKRGGHFYSTYEEASLATQRLGIKSTREYERRYKEDPLLHCAPNEKYTNSWIGFPEFFGKEINRTEKYSTYEEAKLATNKLGIIGVREYKKRYKEDPKLISSPHITYKKKGWVDYNDFLGLISPYITYEEASLAAKSLGVRHQKEYKQRYKENSKLVLSPDKLYKNSWISYDEFLGVAVYPTYEEAKIAVSNLGITLINEYYKRYKENPRLPSAPNKIYKEDWQGFSLFLGKEPKIKLYSTYEEASLATQKLNIKSWKQYKDMRKEDPKLPSNPNKTYKKTWKDIKHFLNK